VKKTKQSGFDHAQPLYIYLYIYIYAYIYIYKCIIYTYTCIGTIIPRNDKGLVEIVYEGLYFPSALLNFKCVVDSQYINGVYIYPKESSKSKDYIACTFEPLLYGFHIITVYLDDVLLSNSSLILTTTMIANGGSYMFMEKGISLMGMDDIGEYSSLVVISLSFDYHSLVIQFHCY
jgi:hypothetical protein